MSVAGTLTILIRKAMAVLEKVLHFAILGFYIIVCSHVIAAARTNTTSSDPNVKNFGKFSARFLTKWTYGMQLLYYITIVFAHILSVVPAMQKASNKLRRFSDLLFTTIVIPIGLVISVTFWTIYNIDRELIFPRWLDKVVPVWINHSLHTFNAVLPLIDMLIVNHTFSSWKLTTACIVLYFGAYLGCLFETYYTYGQWLYPIFAKLTNLQIVFFVLSTILFALLFHALARIVCKLRWGTVKWNEYLFGKTANSNVNGSEPIVISTPVTIKNFKQ